MTALHRFALCLLVAAPIYGEWPHINDKLKNRKEKIASAVILPARTELTKVGFHGGEGMEPEAQKFSATFYKLVSEELIARGVQVLPNPAEPPPAAEVKYAIADLQAKYDNIGVQLRKKLGGVENGKYTLGDRAAAFEPARSADVLVFLRARGAVSTPGRAAATIILFPLGSFGTFHADIGLVDAKSGEVLAFLRMVRSSDPTVNTEEKFPKAIRESLREVPLRIPAPK